MVRREVAGHHPLGVLPCNRQRTGVSTRLRQFQQSGKCAALRGQVASQLNLEIQVQPVMTGSAASYRVATAPLTGQALQEAIHDARAHDIEFWRFATADVELAPNPEPESELTAVPAEVVVAPPQTTPAAAVRAVEPIAASSARSDNATFDVDLGLENTFIRRSWARRSKALRSVHQPDRAVLPEFRAGSIQRSDHAVRPF